MHEIKINNQRKLLIEPGNECLFITALNSDGSMEYIHVIQDSDIVMLHNLINYANEKQVSLDDIAHDIFNLIDETEKKLNIPF